jgi:phospholipid/cholesterol/gamma-HCH transport system substrate-binding protein
MSPSPLWFKTRRRLGGLAFLMVIALLVWLSLALYNKQFTPVDLVTLRTDSVGNEMHAGADVRFRGVLVGQVRTISANGGGATLGLAIAPDQTAHLPANVSAELVPTTLFGERYVDLIEPGHPVTARLTGGSTISQDRSRDAIELEKVLNDLLPLLTAVQPQKLSVTLTAMAQALQGRGGQLGQTLDQLDAYLKQLNPNLPALDADITELAQVTSTYTQAAPSIIQALNDFTVTSRTIADQQRNLATLYATLTGASRTLTSFLTDNQDNIIRLSATSLPTLKVLARYAPEFPCVLQDLGDFEPAVDKVLGKGTSQPGLHVNVHPVPSLGKYVVGRDTPAYHDNSGPHCYGVPFTGVRLNDGTSPPATTASPASAGSLGLPNTPQENELVNELLSPSLNTPPQSLPDWSSVLVGPLYRGTEVTVK